MTQILHIPSGSLLLFVDKNHSRQRYTTIYEDSAYHLSGYFVINFLEDLYNNHLNSSFRSRNKLPEIVQEEEFEVLT